jgi:hypothetical protein
VFAVVGALAVIMMAASRSGPTSLL